MQAPTPRRTRRFTALLACGLASGAQAEHTASLPSMTVVARPLSPFVLQSEWTPLAEPNTALLLKRIPGANVNFNGTLAGVAQYRGLYGARVNVLVDGLAIGNACSNNMDAPLHYMPRSSLENLEVIRGIAPVSSGMETIGGTVRADSRPAQFGADSAFEWHGDFGLGGQSVDSGYAGSGRVSLANERQLFYAGASRDKGDDRRFDDSRIRPTRYQRDAWEAGYGLDLEGHRFNFDYRRNETGETGTPALMMDDIYSNADLGRVGYSAQWGGVDIDARGFVTSIDHLMNNYGMRRAMAGMERYSLAQADGAGWQLAGRLDFAGGTLALGTEGHLLTNASSSRNPFNPAFFITGFNDAERDRLSVYAEWDRSFARQWDAQLGLRYTRVDMDTGLVDTSMAVMPGPARRLRDAFNAADRSRVDDNVEAVAKLVYRVHETLSLETGVARKVRSPSYLERFLWLPMEASGGLADGNVYVGNLALDPETAWQFELGLDWSGERHRFAPRAYFHRVDDYIQGTPATDADTRMVGTMMGDATPLRFTNVDARLYGVDVEWGYALTERWALDGVLSYVRGERRDIDDDLYRIAPLNGLVDLSYRRERWSATAETVWYAAQDDVSLTNGETRSPGYGLLNLYGQYTFPDQGLTLSAGVENVLDKTYQPHLNGLNRVASADLPAGLRLPGDGVSGFVQARLRF